ncbi:hypothetical protein ACFPVV_03280 [Macrococcoides bohemicum]|uniref:hypothetical protein n=1 Tax=Macrococcoides bohemicum TaxID=1903056 RepID=UPI0014748CE4|nr:hypothetical protein [Macrococcus bohemicus]
MQDSFKVPSDKGQNIKFVEVENTVTTPTTEEPTTEQATTERPTTKPCPNGRIWCRDNY